MKRKRKRKRRTLLRLIIFEYFERGIFLQLTSPEEVSQTLLSQIRTRTCSLLTAHTPYLPNSGYFMLHSKHFLAYLQRMNCNLALSSPSFYYLLHSYCTVGSARLVCWKIFQSVIIHSNSITARLAAHHSPPYTRPCPCSDLETQAPADLYFRVRPINCFAILLGWPKLSTPPRCSTASFK